MTTPNPQIIDRISKLLALASDPSNHHEAAAAAAKAQEILDQYNLSMADVQARDGSRPEGGGVVVTKDYAQTGRSRQPLLKQWGQLIYQVALYNRCTTIREEFIDTSYFTVIGEATNVQATIRIYDYLKQQLDVEMAGAWSRYRKEMQANGLRLPTVQNFRMNFLRGACHEIGRIMKERQEASVDRERITALAVNHDVAVQKYVSQAFPNLGKGRASRHQRNANAYERGKETGGRIERSRVGGLKGGQTALPGGK